MDILSDILTNSLFTEPAMDSERDTILREMKSIDEQINEVNEPSFRPFFAYWH
jgi:predicted Zn-dependent peptidase